MAVNDDRAKFEALTLELKRCEAAGVPLTLRGRDIINELSALASAQAASAEPAAATYELSVGSPEVDNPCGVCGVLRSRHGTYPTCATHHYSPITTASNDSFVRNCFIAARPGEEGPLFVDRGDGVFVARLDGYVICPKEKLREFAASGAVDADPPALASAQAQSEPAPLTDERIDHIADLVVKGMPEGISGFCKSWGWRQFARAILADCAGHVAEPAAPAAQSAEILPLDRPVDWHMDGKPITYRDCIRNQCGELALSYAEEIQRAALASQKGA